MKRRVSKTACAGLACVLCLGLAFGLGGAPGRASAVAAAETKAEAQDAANDATKDATGNAADAGAPGGASAVAAAEMKAEAQDATGSATSEATNGATNDATDTQDDEPEETYEGWSLEDLNRAVEEKTAARNALQEQFDALAGQIGENRAHLEQMAGQLPQKQAAAERAVVERYKVQRQYPTLIEILLDAQDLDSFIAGVEYIAAASEASIDEFTELRDEYATTERMVAGLEARQRAVTTQLEKAETRLKTATEARDEKQRKADMVANTHLTPDGANWDEGKDAFVEQWRGRIDAFLDGTPLAGQGEAFAKAAWDVHIDPRWSAAISNIESSKGRYCIRPFNAWGWGADDSAPAAHAFAWSSWEEAINAHAQGLASGYGYTVSPEGAQKYCPPNWEIWYVTVVNGMNSM